MWRGVFIICIIWYLCGPIQALETKHETSFVVFPVDCNANPPMLFGGKILAEMDRCAAICARRALYESKVTSDYVTVGINNVKFVKSGQVKDLIYVNSEIVKLGEKSITIKVLVQRENRDKSRDVLCEAEFVFVAYDVANKKSVAHGLSITKE